MKPIYIIADLHLNENEPEITHAFLAFLNKTAKEASELYIIGDLFDAWIGDDNHTPLHSLVASKLKQLSESTHCYFMPGNRDFLLGKSYAKQAGLHLIEETEYTINAFNHKYIILHGDTLCTDDESYQKYRKIVHNKVIQWLFLKLPLRLRLRFAKKLRKQSKITNQQKHSIVMDVNQTAVNQLLLYYQPDYIIHGHTHKPGKHEIKISESTAPKYRVVSGSWDNFGWVIKIDTEVTLEAFSLVDLSEQISIN